MQIFKTACNAVHSYLVVYYVTFKYFILDRKVPGVGICFQSRASAFLQFQITARLFGIWTKVLYYHNINSQTPSSDIYVHDSFSPAFYLAVSLFLLGILYCFAFQYHTQPVLP